MSSETKKLLKKLETKYHLARALGQKKKALNIWKLKTKVEISFLRKN